MFFKKNYRGILLVDFHDVLTNLQEFKVQQGNGFAKKYGHKLEHPNVYESKKMFGWTDHIDEEFWDLFLPQFLHAMDPKKIAREALYQLRKEGYKIIVMYQPNTFDLSKKMSKYQEKQIRPWLKRNQLSYDECLVTNKDLLEVVRTKHITGFITANPSLAEHVATSYPTILFNQSYNQGLDGANMTRVLDWKEVYQKLKIKTEE